MRRCDVFIIEDSIQYEQQGFTNRNRIKTPNGAKWLTVPVEHVGSPLRINEVNISNKAEPDWAKRHWLTLKHNYCKAEFWTKFSDFFEQTYNQQWTRLLDLNMHLIKGIMTFLSIETPMVMASSLGVCEKKSDAVLAKCKAVRADTQLAGIGAKEYLDLRQFEKEGIKVVFQDFRYPAYRQLHGDFVPNLSAIDYLFCAGNKPW